MPAGQVELVDLDEDAPRQAQAFVDPVAVVQVRIVDEALPADGRARLFEIDAHHHDEVGGEFALLRRQACRVVDRGVVVVDRTGADDDEQPIVGAVQNPVDRLARLVGGRRGALGRRKLPQQVRRWGELHDFPDAGVVDRQLGRRRMGQRGGPIALGGRLGQSGSPKIDFTGKTIY